MSNEKPCIMPDVTVKDFQECLRAAIAQCDKTGNYDYKMSCVLFDVDEQGVLRLYATDSVAALEVTVGQLTAMRAKSCIVPRRFCEFLTTLDSGANMEFAELTSCLLVIQSNGLTYCCEGVAGNFPNVKGAIDKAYDLPGASIQLDAAILRNVAKSANHLQQLQTFRHAEVTSSLLTIRGPDEPITLDNASIRLAMLPMVAEE